MVVEERHDVKLGGHAKTGGKSGEAVEERHRVHACVVEVRLEDVGDGRDKTDLEHAEERVELAVVFVYLAPLLESLL
jgi:hypothetical protein